MNGDLEGRVRISHEHVTDTGAIQLMAADRTTVALGTSEHGGFMGIFNKVLDTPVFSAAITANGAGYALTHDNEGRVTDGIGLPGRVQAR